MAQVLEIPDEILVIPSDLLYYKGQVIAMLRWSAAQARGEGEIPNHAEADLIARR